MHLFYAFVLLAICVLIHASGMVLTSHYLIKFRRGRPSTLLGSIGQLIGVAWALIFFHILEICVWGFFYWGKGCLPDAATAFYFSGVTYTTLGYGDVVLPAGWRMLGPSEGLTGILMCGLSTAFFFALVERLVRPESVQTDL